MNFLEDVWEGVLNTSWLEWLAVLSSIAYVILASKRIIYCWFFAFFASALFVYLCFSVQLYIEAILQVFYVVMALVGWFTWKKTESEKHSIKTWSWSYHFWNILLSGIIALILGYLFDLYTEQANPYADAFTTCFSLLATFMVTKKILENWIYWVVIDIVSIFLYAQRGFQLTAFQYAVFTILALIGFFSWWKQYQAERMHSI